MRNNLRGLFWLLVIVTVDAVFMAALLLVVVINGLCIFVDDRFAGLRCWVDRRFDELYKDW
ncbi:MAG: hypothetical protein ACXV8Q_00470 [Methylobacter sp.]